MASPPTGSACVSLWEGYPPRGTDSWEPLCLSTWRAGRPGHRPGTDLCLASDRRVRDFLSSSLGPWPSRCDPHSFSLHTPLGEGCQIWQIKIRDTRKESFSAISMPRVVFGTYITHTYRVIITLLKIQCHRCLVLCLITILPWEFSGHGGCSLLACSHHRSAASPLPGVPGNSPQGITLIQTRVCLWGASAKTAALPVASP